MHKINLFIACFLYVSFLYSSGDDLSDFSFDEEKTTAIVEEKNPVAKPNNSKKPELINFDDWEDDFVLETKQIKIPNFPKAFNPSIARWKNQWLLSFRIMNPNSKRNFIGLVWLDQDFNLNSKTYILQITNDKENTGVLEQDARLFVIGDRLFVLYNNNCEKFKSQNDIYRMHVGEIDFDGNRFYTKFSKRIELFDNQNNCPKEKNWVPFSYNERLHLAYSLNPHQIYCCMETGVCTTCDLTEAAINWKWGELRGGTPALLEKDCYIGFFHSCKSIKSVQSKGKIMRHYFMGAYVFSNNPPFAIEKISAKPIIGPQFYSGTPSEKYPNKPNLRCVFPGGIVIEENNIWVFYGRQDCEVWAVKMDKQKLLDSLVSVNPK